MRAEAQAHIDQINSATALLRRFLDWDRALKRLDELNAKVEDPTLWNDPKAAQNVMRWEDYTQTAVDPSDDCTIWYVGDYLKKDADRYSTRIGAFRLPGCPR